MPEPEVKVFKPVQIKALFLIAILGSSVMGCQSGKNSPPSMPLATDATHSGSAAEPAPPEHLVSCPASPNCVGSTESDASAVPVFELTGNPDVAQGLLENAIVDDGGKIRLSMRGYIWATYTSRIFRFVDDIEFLALIPAAEATTSFTTFNVRSASRVGYSDLGANRKRVNRLLQALRTDVD